MSFSLFTVLIEFEDRTIAIEQISSTDANAALEMALRQSEALSNLDREAVSELISKRLRLNQVAHIRGVWTWHQVPEEGAEAREIYGGAVIQTDPTGSVRD